MTTCEDCLHNGVCVYQVNTPNITKCPNFKNKYLYRELPCKVGDKVYQTDGVRLYESEIKNVIYETEGIAFDERAIGQSVFLTREEAEKALAERENS